MSRRRPLVCDGRHARPTCNKSVAGAKAGNPCRCTRPMPESREGTARGLRCRGRSARRPARLQRCSGATCVAGRGAGPVSAACQAPGRAGRRAPTRDRAAAALAPTWPGGQGAAAAVCGLDEGDSVDIDSASFGRGAADGGCGTSGSGLVGFFTACWGAQVRLLPENLVIGLFQRWLFHASTPSAGSRWEPAAHGAAGVLHHLTA